MLQYSEFVIISRQLSKYSMRHSEEADKNSEKVGALAEFWIAYNKQQKHMQSRNMSFVTMLERCHCLVEMTMSISSPNVLDPKA